MAAHGSFYWNELVTRDPKKAKDFYGKTLGWTFDDMPMPGGPSYTILKSDGQQVGGMMQATADMNAAQDFWFTYIAVDDLDGRLKKLKDAGGKVMREPMDVPGVGRIAMVTDPGGASQGWMVPAPGT
jgi:predicted enzyme related to lactoylglutathione lyase